MSNQSLIEEGKQYVMNTYGRLPVVMTSGKGCRVWDADGKEYLDFVAGVAVNGLGHCHPEVTAAIAAQAAKLIHCSNLYWIEPQIKLAHMLCDHSCFDKVFFCNSGAEANEGAIKLARKYAKTFGRGEGSYEVITLLKSFHGRTLATLTATGQDKVKKGFAPLPEGFRYVPINDLPALEAAISDKTCAVMLEPIQGEGGVNLCDFEYLKSVRALCDRLGILLIYDEVQVGLGRTGKLFCYQHAGVEPDIMTIAKALGGGVPIGALLAKDKIAAAFQPGDHATTFGGNPLVTAAGCAAFDIIANKGIVENSAKMGEYLRGKLRALGEKYSCVKDVRGLGLLIGFELDREAGPLASLCMEKGLLLNCATHHTIRLAPPLILKQEEADEAVAIIDEALGELLAKEE